MQVSVGTVQVQPVPETAVTVRPGGGVSVTVTVPLDGEPPTFEDPHGVRDGLPGGSDARAVRLRKARSLPDAGAAMIVGSVAMLLLVFGLPPPDTTALFVTVPGGTVAPTLVVTVIAG